MAEKMYYRRRILLALLKTFPEKTDRLRLQKLLFLLNENMPSAVYHFLPYKFGCFSFQANADILTLEKTGLILKTETGWTINDNATHLFALHANDLKCIEQLRARFGNFSNDELITYTYEQFPFYAINSTIAHRYLSAAGMEKVDAAKSKEKSGVLFTLGYEGLALEQYINLLLKQNVKLLLDVRKNAMSMKYGYSKGTLRSACDNAGIIYEHCPDVGIISDKRKNLQTQADYEVLFSDYRKTTLSQTVSVQLDVCRKIETAGRAVLLCFEKSPSMCHRSHLAAALMHHFTHPIKLEHLHG